MDATVTVKYFRISKPTAQAPNLESILQTLSAHHVADREVTLDEGIILRLERLEREATYLVGEFCRVQRENIPPSAGADGLTPTVLEEGKGLGHLAAFRYHVPTKILLLQINQQCATANRISMYLGLSEGKPMYVLEPVLRVDALARLGRGKIKQFKAKFAEPENIEALDDTSLSALEGVKRAAELLHAHEITIIVSAGRKTKKRKRPLLLQAPVRRILSKLSGEDDVTLLKANVDEGDKTNWIDLLEEQMKYSERLELPSDNPEQNYLVRKSFLSRIFNGNISELKRLYGKRDDDDSD